MVASTRRVKGGYCTHYSDAIWPNTDIPMEQEVKRLMDESLYLLQESIRKSPGEWLWQHNRWKQQTPNRVYRPFRKDCICIIMPEEEKEFLELKDHIKIFRKIYPEEHITLMLPQRFENTSLLDASEIIGYASLKDTFRKDYRFKLVYNFTKNTKIAKHYLKLSAIGAYSLEDLIDKTAANKADYSSLLFRALIRPSAR